VRAWLPPVADPAAPVAGASAALADPYRYVGRFQGSVHEAASAHRCIFSSTSSALVTSQHAPAWRSNWVISSP
jgi:hypothetical protein